MGATTEMLRKWPVKVPQLRWKLMQMMIMVMMRWKRNYWGGGGGGGGFTSGQSWTLQFQQSQDAVEKCKRKPPKSKTEKLRGSSQQKRRKTAGEEERPKKMAERTLWN